MSKNSYKATRDLFDFEQNKAEYVDRLPPASEIQSGDIYIIRNFESRYLTHKFHKYAGKFTPEVPRWALHSYLPTVTNSVVLDPFVGSGTTLVEASLLPITAVGIDVDPLARLITKVKTTPIQPDVLRTVIIEVSESLKSPSPVGEIPSISTLSHWFTDQTIRDLSCILGVVEGYHDRPDVYDFLTVCFSAVIRRASNADNQTMKTYVSHTHPKTPESALLLFAAVLEDYQLRMEKYASKRDVASRTIILDQSDARSLASNWERLNLGLVDLAITSPPYIKSVDYIYNQMAELFWIGKRWGIETQPKQNEFKKRYMGNDRPVSEQTETLPQPLAISEIDTWVTLVTSKDRKLGRVIGKYFLDTLNHFRSMSHVLRPGGRYVYVVGNSTLAGIAIPTHELVVQCAAQAGFALELCFGYEIRNKHMRFPRGRNGGQVAHDWVLTFKLDEGPYGGRKPSDYHWRQPVSS